MRPRRTPQLAGTLSHISRNLKLTGIRLSHRWAPRHSLFHLKVKGAAVTINVQQLKSDFEIYFPFLNVIFRWLFGLKIVLCEFVLTSSNQYCIQD